MSHVKPWLTSNNLVNAVKRKIILPTSQNTFQTDDILAFLNEELGIGLVPEILSFNEEFFVYSKEIPLEPNKTRYPIPYRAIGLKLRDLAWKDDAGNINEMSRISASDKAYFQNGVNYDSSLEKFFIEANDIVLARSTEELPSGTLVMSFYLKPNQLVRDNRSAIIESFLKKVTVENAFLATPGVTLKLYTTEFKTSTTNSGSITGFTSGLTTTTLVSTAHNLSSGYKITISGSSSSPSINGTYAVTVIDANTFTIPKATVTGSGVGTWTSPNLVIVGANSTITASNLTNSINNESTFTATSSGADVTISYLDIQQLLTTSDENAFNLNSDFQGVRFDNVPTSDFNSETGVTESLFSEGLYVDLIQTDGGHQNKVYDLLIPVGGFVSSTDIYFYSDEIPDILVVGDYMCLSNECIIPQIPSDLHTLLTERACARILAAIGDTEGFGMTQAKIAEGNRAQGLLIDNRVEGAPIKINTKHSMLRYQKGSI